MIMREMTFARLAALCRADEAGRVYQMGDQIISPHPLLGSVLWDVIAIGPSVRGELITLQMHSPIEFDMPFDIATMHQREGQQNSWARSTLRWWLNDPEGMGFLSGWDQDDIDAIRENLHGTETQPGTYRQTRDRVFLLTEDNVGLGDNEASALAFYRGHPERRIRRSERTGSIRPWWLRTPSKRDAASARIVDESGNLSTREACSVCGVLPAVTIG